MKFLNCCKTAEVISFQEF